MAGINSAIQKKSQEKKRILENFENFMFFFLIYRS